jgi:hypothetical protein
LKKANAEWWMQTGQVLARRHDWQGIAGFINIEHQSHLDLCARRCVSLGYQLSSDDTSLISSDDTSLISSDDTSYSV